MGKGGGIERRSGCPNTLLYTCSCTRRYPRLARKFASRVDAGARGVGDSPTRDQGPEYARRGIENRRESSEGRAGLPRPPLEKLETGGGKDALSSGVPLPSRTSIVPPPHPPRPNLLNSPAGCRIRRPSNREGQCRSHGDGVRRLRQPQGTSKTGTPPPPPPTSKYRRVPTGRLSASQEARASGRSTVLG